MLPTNRFTHMKADYTVIKVTEGKDFQGNAKFNVKLRGYWTDEVLGLKTQRTYYFTSYKPWTLDAIIQLDIKEDYDVREFEYDTKDPAVGVLKLKALAPKGTEG